VNPKLHQVAVCLDAAEYRQFKFWVSARGVSQSAYIREQLSFDVKPRGAPKGVLKKRKVGRPKKSAGQRRVKSGKPLSSSIELQISSAKRLHSLPRSQV